jgi:transglutaminase-like putative cysteine protease
MKKNTWSFFVPSILILIIMVSGCEMIFPPTTYEATPTRIKYDITYGYHVNATGTGRYQLTYFCDTPEVLIGTTTYSFLHTSEYEIKNLFNNTVIHWNISRKNPDIVTLGITSKVEVESYLVPDLNGKDSLTIKQIYDRYPELFKQYTQLQANETIRFIDPSNPDIIRIAETVYTNAQTNNSFLVSKSLFSWLKQNITYQIQPDERVVRSAAVTLSKKQGDCDDISFLYISLCRTLDIPARFIRGYLISKGINGSLIATPHAWTEVFVGQPGTLNGWIPIECSCCTPSLQTDINQNFGVESAYHLRLFTDDGSNASLEASLSGISYITHEPNIIISLEPFAEVSNYQELESKKLVVTDKNLRYYD